MHCGLHYKEVKYASGIGFKLDQDEYVQMAKPMVIDQKRQKEVESHLTPQEMPGFQGVIGGLLWLCLTHFELMCEVVLIQQEVTRAKVKHALAANAIVMRMKRYGESIGLHLLLSLHRFVKSLSMIRAEPQRNPPMHRKGSWS